MADVEITGTVTVTSPSFTAELGQPVDAGDVSVDVGGTPTPLDDVLTGIGAKLTRRVAVFADDFDPTGSFTTVPLLDVGAIPRAYLTGATVLIVEGDHLGLWTIPASGPATAGTALAPGDTIASESGRTATAYTEDGTTVAGVHVGSVAVDVDAWAIADQRAQAEVATAPTKWARCGAPIPDNNGHFATSWTIPTPTTSMRIRALVRDLATDLGDDGEAFEYHEYASESLDGTGDNDRYEAASETIFGPGSGARLSRSKVKDYAESTAFGETEEWHKAGGEDPARAPTTSGVWIEKEWEWDLAAETLTIRYRSDMLGTYVDADDETRWAVTGVRSHPGLGSIADTAGEDSWIGMGHGLFHIARVRRWVDGTLVSDFDASTAEADDTTVTDAVALDDNDDPVVWTGVDLAIIEEAAAAGGGVSLGETSTTAYRGDRGKTAYDHSQVTTGNPHGTTAADVGAAADDDARLTDTRTPTDGTVSAAKLDAALAARIGTTVEATSDSTARTSTTYTADGTLQFEGAADTTYRIDAYLIFQGDATADLKVGFSTPAGTMHLTVEGALITVASGSDYDRFLTLTSSGATAIVGIAGPSTPIAVRISGVIHLTSAGTVSFGWAPNATGAGTGVTRLARSQLYYRAV